MPWAWCWIRIWSLPLERTGEGRGKQNGHGSAAKWNQKGCSNLGNLDSRISDVAGMCGSEEDTAECVVRFMLKMLSILVNDMANKKWQSSYMEVLQTWGTKTHLLLRNILLIQIYILLFLIFRPLRAWFQIISVGRFLLLGRKKQHHSCFFLSFPSFLILTIFPVITLFTSVFYIEVSHLVISTCGCFPWPGSYKGQERLYLHGSPSFPRDLYVSLLISSGF